MGDWLTGFNSWALPCTAPGEVQEPHPAWLTREQGRIDSRLQGLATCRSPCLWLGGKAVSVAVPRRPADCQPAA